MRVWMRMRILSLIFFIAASCSHPNGSYVNSACAACDADYTATVSSADGLPSVNATLASPLSSVFSSLLHYLSSFTFTFAENDFPWPSVCLSVQPRMGPTSFPALLQNMTNVNISTLQVPEIFLGILDSVLLEELVVGVSACK